MIFAPVLSLLLEAAAETHDEVRLRAQLTDLLVEIWLTIPYDPVLPDRLRALVPMGAARLEIHDAERVVDSLESMDCTRNNELCSYLVRLRLIVARLGGVNNQMRIGRIVSEELRLRDNVIRLKTRQR